MKSKTVFKIVVSVVMLALVLRLVDFSGLRDTLFSINIFAAIVVILGYTAGQVLSTYKWLLIARAGGVQAPYPLALKAYFIGMYVNCFGLGTVGGDVTRGVLLARGEKAKAAAITSVLADRAHGLAVLALLGTVTTAALGHYTLDAAYTYIICAIGVVMVTGWFVGPKILLKIVGPENRLRQRVEEISQVFPKDTRRVALITFISLAFHILQIALHWVMGKGFGIDLPWTYLLVGIPFVNILSSLPISWNGLGIRENAYVLFLGAVLTSEQAVAFGALWLVAVTLNSGVGGIVAVLTKDPTLAKPFKGKIDLSSVGENVSESSESVEPRKVTN